MGFLDKFIKVTEEETTETNQSSVTNQPANPTPVPQQVYVPQMTINEVAASNNVVSNVVQPDMNLVKELYQDLIDEKSLSGDYLELKKNAEALNSMGFNDQQRFQAALQVMRATRATLKKEDMLQSVESYITKISEIKSIASQQCDERVVNIQKSVSNSINACESVINNKRNEILELQKQIAVLENAISEQTVEIARLKADGDVKYNNLMKERHVFEASVEFVTKNLSDDKNIISQLQ